MWWIGLLVLAPGCTKKPPAMGPMVRRVTFEGQGGMFTTTSTAALRDAMAHPVPRGLPLLRSKKPLKEDVLEADRTRLAVHMAEEGFFDATVDFDVEVVREGTNEKPPIVDIHGTVERGDRYPVAEATTAGLDVLEKPPEPWEGGAFTVTAHEAFEMRGLKALKEEAYAYATVAGEAKVDRSEKQVRTAYTFEPGRTAVYGPITLQGGERLPQGILQASIRMEEGNPYDLSSQEETKQQLYGLGVFSYVTVTPDLSDPTREVVPVKVKVEPRKPRSIAGGFGVNVQSGRQEALARIRLQHLNAFRKMVRFRIELQGGYAVLANNLAAFSNTKGVRSGVVVDSEMGINVPGVFMPRWAVDAEIAYHRDLTETFIVDRPTATLSYAGPLVDHLQLAVAYRVRYARYSDVQVPEEILAAETRNFDLADGGYFLTELSETLVLDTRDQPLQPKTGMRHELSLSQAGRFLGGNFDYLGARLDLRGYRSLEPLDLPFMVLAGRVGGGWLQPYGPAERAAVPVAERLYLGGAESVRGWVYQHLGPSLQVAEDDEVPIGGRISAYGSLELRFSNETIGGAVFSDWGMVWADQDAIGQDPLLTPSVGVGGRLITPAGPIRLDVAMRTDRQERYADEPRVWLHLGIGEAF